MLKEILGAPDKSSALTKDEKRMNIRPSHASAWKGDLIIQLYCEKRSALSKEFSSEVIELFNSLNPAESGNSDQFDYHNAIESLS